MMELWGDEEPESDALRSHIYNLRKMVDKPFDLVTTFGDWRIKIFNSLN
jgi:DNA-binding response OmpR family regulator